MKARVIAEALFNKYLDARTANPCNVVSYWLDYQDALTAHGIVATLQGYQFSRSSRAVIDACDAQDLFELDYLETFAK